MLSLDINVKENVIYKHMMQAVECVTKQPFQFRVLVMRKKLSKPGASAIRVERSSLWPWRSREPDTI